MNTSLAALLGARSIDELYVLVPWPDVQEFMDYEWFQKECFLHQAFYEQEYIPSAYFVPLMRIIAVRRPG